RAAQRVYGRYGNDGHAGRHSDRQPRRDTFGGLGDEARGGRTARECQPSFSLDGGPPASVLRAIAMTTSPLYTYCSSSEPDKRLRIRRRQASRSPWSRDRSRSREVLRIW